MPPKEKPTPVRPGEPGKPPPVRVMPERPDRGRPRNKPARPDPPPDTPPGVGREYPPDPPMPQE